MSRNSHFSLDWQLIVPVVVLAVLSLSTLLSLNFVFFKNQLIYFIFSFLVFLFFSQSQLKVLKLYSFPIYIFSFIVLLIVLFIGFESRGATRWITIFGIQIQFSEILKPFLAITFSSFLSQKGISFKTFFLTFCFFMPLGLLIYLQPDLGSMLLYALVIIFVLLAYGFPFIWFGAGVAIFSVIFPFVWHFLREYQRQRVLTFLNPTKDPLGVSYNVIQSIIAIGSGMVFGKGISEGTQSGLRFLPERHTDFIFATISESLGFIGSSLILLTFVFLLYRIYLIFNNSHDSFSKTFALCAFFLILIQMFVNVGMNIGILPIVGITLPFVSYGGSSLLSNFILLGFLSSIQKDIKRESTLEIR